MLGKRRIQLTAALTCLAYACTLLPGCTFSVNFGPPDGSSAPPPPDVPRETAKVTLPAYVIETPDILIVDLLRALPDRPLTREQRLVRPDGTIGLGYYGAVRVAGLSIEQARQAIEDHLSRYIKNPQVTVDIFAYNSKAYYVIEDGAGFGQQVIRIPYTGNETVLDAISQAGGLPTVSDKKLIWLARPAPPGRCNDQILPIDWKGISQGGQTATNYQVLPNDRIFIHSDPLLRTDGFFAKLLAPVNRIMGALLLAGATIGVLHNPAAAAGGGGRGGGF